MDGREYLGRDSPEESRYGILSAGELLGELRNEAQPGSITPVHTDGS
jgi:hypothetical protein